MNITQLFDLCAASYDRDRPKLVPCFDEFYGTVIRLIPFEPSAKFRCLDLGAGTGLLAALVKQAFPNAAVHLTDASEAMLAQAQIRFRGTPAVSYAVHDHLALAAVEEYDVVVSALSVHHLPHEQKRELYAKIFRALRPGGHFIHADQVLGPTPEQEAVYQAAWLAHARKKGISADALAQAMERISHDVNAPLADQLLWLSDAGFKQIDCWFKSFRFAVFGGTKRR
jgi:tRNA (cmo5U34)-methyltransferase